MSIKLRPVKLWHIYTTEYKATVLVKQQDAE